MERRIPKTGILTPSEPKDKELQIDDLMYSYKTNTYSRQKDVREKYEFFELSTDVFEDTPERGKYFKHQTFVHRYMIPYDRLLLMWKTGTGKSCGAAGVSEILRKSFMDGVGNYINDYIHPRLSTIKKVYILVSGDTIASEFKKQIYCKCSSPDSYEYNAEVLDSPTTTIRTNALNNILKKYYEVMTYGKFTEDIRDKSKATSNATIRELYSNCLFIIDEAHNLVYDPRKPTHVVSRGELVRKDQSNEYKATHMRAQDGTIKPFKKKAVYDAISRVFEISVGTKVILLTATPMVNSSQEIPMILNLLLPRSKKMPLNVEYKNTTADYMAKYASGLVSYIGAVRSKVNVKYMGNTIKDAIILNESEKVKSSTVVYESIMKKTASKGGKGFPGQYTAYEGIVNNIDIPNIRPTKSTRGNPKRNDNAFYNKHRQASNFIFPDGSIGNVGFNKYIIKGNNNSYSLGKCLRGWVSDLNNLKALSIKFGNIIELCNKSKGKVFIYTNLKMGSGAILLMLCMMAQGYNRFIPPKAREEMSPLCPSTKTKINYNGISNGVALLIPEIGSGMSTILDYFNHKDNMHGEHIKVLITSPVGREGINTTNVLQVHVVDPDWSPTKTYQGISRSLRGAGHDELIHEAEDVMLNATQVILEYYNGYDDFGFSPKIVEYISDKFIESMQTYEEHFSGGLTYRNLLWEQFTNLTEYILDALQGKANANSNRDDIKVLKKHIAENKRSNVQVTVEIYQHAAVGPKNAIDMRMYMSSEVKSRDIKRMERILKTLAVDCSINKKRNVNLEAVDGSEECDYGKCNYVCHDDGEIGEMDYHSYDVLYNKDEINTIITKIHSYFSNNFSINEKNLIKLLKGHRKTTIYLAIHQMITEKNIFMDRFGNCSYITERDGLLFIQGDYPDGNNTDFMKSYYSSNPTSVVNVSLKHYIEEMEAPIIQLKISGLVKDIGNVSYGTGKRARQENDILKIFRSMNYKAKISLFEIIYKKVIDGIGTYGESEIFNKYKGLVHSINKDSELVKSLSMLDLTQKKRRSKRINEFTSVSDKKIYVHSLYNLESVDTYNMSSNTFRVSGSIRIYNKEIGGWTNSDENENEIYTYKINKILDGISNEYKENAMKLNGTKIYGSLLEDGKFRIINGDLENTNKRDKRKHGRGIVCNTMGKSEIINTLVKIGANVEISEERDNAKMKKTLKSSKIKYDDSDFVAKYSWLAYTRSELCPMAMKHLERSNLLLKRDFGSG